MLTKPTSRVIRWIPLPFKQVYRGLHCLKAISNRAGGYGIKFGGCFFDVSSIATFFQNRSKSADHESGTSTLVACQIPQLVPINRIGNSLVGFTLLWVCSTILGLNNFIGGGGEIPACWRTSRLIDCELPVHSSFALISIHIHSELCDVLNNYVHRYSKTADYQSLAFII